MNKKISKEQFINSLKSNWNFDDEIFEQVWSETNDLTDATEFTEYYYGETLGGANGTIKEYFEDFMEEQ